MCIRDRYIEYNALIDIWSIGCIFAEMVTGRPLFRGENDKDQVNRILRTLGTPTEEDWGGVLKVKEILDKFPVYEKKPLKESVEGLDLDKAGMDLLEVSLY